MNVETTMPEAKPEKPVAGRGAVWSRVQELEQQVGELKATVKAQAGHIERHDLLLARLAEAMGRRDLLVRPATVEQLRAGYKAGRTLLVLKDCKSHGLDLRNGTKVEARQYPLEDMVELLERGLLAIAIVE